MPTPSQRIKARALELGFSGVGIADIAPLEAQARYEAWLSSGHHGEMSWLDWKLRNLNADLFGPELSRSLIEGSLFPTTAIKTGFNADAEDKVWYYRALVDAFAANPAHPPALVDELDRVVTEMERLK